METGTASPFSGSLICGIDEAGRGSLAGPVCAAAVILPKDFPVEILDDSKKLSEKKREKAREIICEKALAWAVGWASHTEIDRVNILQASLLAMERAFGRMLHKTEAVSAGMSSILAIVDGPFIPRLPVKARPEIKADARFPAVMAASILAKTIRDQEMVHYSLFYPQYGYEKHKGYPTRAHRDAIKRHGFSPIQRISFNFS